MDERLLTGHILPDAFKQTVKKGSGYRSQKYRGKRPFRNGITAGRLHKPHGMRVGSFAERVEQSFITAGFGATQDQPESVEVVIKQIHHGVVLWSDIGKHVQFFRTGALVKGL